MKFAVLMPAAGGGQRLGAVVPKALVELGGLPLFVHALQPFLDLPNCEAALVAVPGGLLDRFKGLIDWYFPNKPVQVVEGGATRQASVGNALNALTVNSEVVCVHDAARPFVSHGLIKRVLDGLGPGAAASVPALALSDTIKEGGGSPRVVIRTVERSSLFAVQTPQAVRTAALRRAYDDLVVSSFESTDDASLIEHFALGAIRLVDGDPRNIKITTQLDLEFARDWFATLT